MGRNVAPRHQAASGERDVWSSSQRRKRRGGKRGRRWPGILLVTGILLEVAVPWAMRPENLRPQKDQLLAFLYQQGHQEGYNAQALLLTDLSNGEAFHSKNQEAPLLPASLAKLFVVEYASTLVGPEERGTVTSEALGLVKPDSSMAWLIAGEYRMEDLFAAMLLPSGNDAAYAVADLCGGMLSPESAPGTQRVDAFLEGLRGYLQEQGYSGTSLYDPSGYDTQSCTTAEDLGKVCSRLLEQSWFRELVSQNTYTALLPDGSSLTWENTNAFLDPDSAYFNPNVKGIKTGSLEGAYNLVVLYQQHGKEFLVVSLGSDSDQARYDAVSQILDTIDESHYLAW